MTVRNSRLECEGATLGREIGVLRLESTRTDCGNETSAVCVEAKEIVLAVNVTGRTGTRKFFKADRIALEKDTFVAMRYFAASDGEEITDWPAWHFRGLSPPFKSRYALSTAGVNDRRRVEMDGPEQGLLIMIDRRPPFVPFWLLPSRVLGMLLDGDGKELNVSAGVTVIDDPTFVWATRMFTSSVSPYYTKRRFFRLSVSMFAMTNRF
jgi:hypothetical protein